MGENGKEINGTLLISYRTTCLNVDLYDNFCHYLEFSVLKLNAECYFS